MTKPAVICLTPIKNEALILHRFLKCASIWADHIIIADQNSTDGSQEIALSFPKVTLIENNSQAFNESERQKMLIEAARQISGPRLLIALDADEILTGNFSEFPEWQTLLEALPGTLIEFEWINILPGFTSYWSPKNWYYPLGFMDDGSDHIGNIIHSPRVPEPPQAPRIRLQRIKVLHYQYLNWQRNKIKQRWYQCYERLNKPQTRLVKIYRMYHQMDAFPQQEIYPLAQEWLSAYENQGIDMTSLYLNAVSWQEQELVEWISKYGTQKFKQIAIWDVNWSEIAQKYNIHPNCDYQDPRNSIDKIIHSWLKQTQAIKNNFFVRLVDKLLMFLGW
jgi:glycosyltransferase involved in cell wall biosynthesis